MQHYDYAVVRVVPRVERGEFVNVGIILSNTAGGWLRACFDLDEAAVLALTPDADLESIRTALNAIEQTCAGRNLSHALAQMTPRERFHWLVAPRSTSIQTSPVHSGYGSDMQAVMDHLMARMVRRANAEQDRA